MIVKGLQKLTLLDFPGRLAATVFLGGCNMRCPFCHNASLVVRDGGENITEEALFSFLESRRGKLSGVCITGGEPTLYKELPTFIKNIRALGYAVKLDTNGTNPEMLRSLIDTGLVDYVAMDIKSSPSDYPAACGVADIDVSKIDTSVQMLLSGNVDYEFRTTVTRELHSLAEMEDIGKWRAGAKRYFLQGFKDSGDLISDGFSAIDTKTEAEFLKAVRVYVPTAQTRG